MRAAIGVLRSRLTANHPICVIHIDQAANDFATLLDLLDNDPTSYLDGQPEVFPSIVGRSFYRQVVPAETVHLGWSSFAAVWLSRVPALVAGHISVYFGNSAERAAFERQAAEDWATFITLRAREIRGGGQLVIVLPARKQDGAIGIAHLFDYANAELSEMVADGSITSEERARMVLSNYARTDAEIRTPFERDSRFRIELCTIDTIPDAAWADYQVTGDGNKLAKRHARFFRATFIPTLATALHDRGAVARQMFADRLEIALTSRLSISPTALEIPIATIVLRRLSE
jgi:hypothetical protein